MAITKTDFINYTRCRRYSALDNLRQDKLTSGMSLEEYKKAEEDEFREELISKIYAENSDGEEIDLTEKVDIQLEALMPYYKRVETEAAKICKKYFGGNFIYSDKTSSQMSYDYVHNGIRYICYVDIYNEQEEEINIIEVKASTTSDFKKEQYGERGGRGKPNPEKYPLFIKKDGINHLSECMSTNPKVVENYNAKLMTLMDKYGKGKYIYDLAIQRMIIEGDNKQHGKTKKVNYYLALLNSEYYYDGYTENDEIVYNTVNNEDIIELYELNNITQIMQNNILHEQVELENWLYNPDNSPCKVGKYCLLKSNKECRYKSICFSKVPNYNTSYNYLDFRGKSMIDDTGIKYDKYDLINDGYYKFDDVPYNWIVSKPNWKIQRDCYDTNTEYINKDKIKAALNNIEYPIYHLDFESLPCPLPRFRGEKPYTQSCFEFSLHIEHSPNECDNDKDNYVFLAQTSKDEREEMVKQIVNRIDISKGTMFAQNVSFERGRLKELAEIFPKYKSHLLSIVEKSTDLIYIVKTSRELFENLGFSKQEASEINYYHKNLSGSFSIKKTLPVLTDISYSELDIKNGTQALVAYSKYDMMEPMELEKTKQGLITYCKQDTWAMVAILMSLREKVK